MKTWLRYHSTMRLPHRLSAIAVACILALPPLHADELPELGDAASNDLSLATEKKIGEQIMHEIRWREPTYLDDPDVESYLNQIGGRLASASSDPAIGFYFFPVNDPSINAFAMPGGFIGVHTGLLLAAQTESELAGVLAHEVSHVTQRHIARQISQEKQLSVATMLGMAVALLAARSNSQVAGAALVSGQASAVSAQLAFSRDFEREADRSGFETLGKAGFDVRGMSNFFERLQRAGRIYENNAPVYMRTHPITGERISDMQNREHPLAYRQIPDSVDFQLVRARLRAMQGPAGEAAKDFQALLRDKKFASEGAAHYGLAVALSRTKDWAGAEKEVLAAKNLRIASSMLDRLLAEARLGQGDVEGGLARYRDAMARYPLNYALAYGYGDALVAHRHYQDSLRFAEDRLLTYPQDVRLHKLRAESHAALGHRALQHRSLAEAYALQGQTGAAVEQLQLAQRAGDANFYELSAIDARLRELKARQAEEAREKRK
ncbi:MAG: Peptidase Ste24p [Rhodocyclaceae bacterium]|nr:Peptidase Ste24p [Rhodocyclaceae bacterium]